MFSRTIASILRPLFVPTSCAVLSRVALRSQLAVPSRLLAIKVRRRPVGDELTQSLGMRFAFGDVAGALEAFEDVKPGSKPPPQAFQVLIRGLARSGDLASAHKFFRQMLGLGLSPDDDTIIQLLEAIGRGKKADVVGDVLDDLERLGHGVVDLAIYHAAMSACLDSEKPDRVQALFQRLLCRNLQPSARTYALAVEASVRCGDMRRAEMLMDETRKTGIAPDIDAFTALIRGWGNRGFLQKAWASLQQMKLDRLQPEARVYDSLVEACAVVSDLNLAMHAFKAMKAQNVQPQPQTIVALLRMCRDIGKLAPAREVWHALRVLRVTPPLEAYELMIELVVVHGEPAAPVAILEEMLVDRVHPPLPLVRSVLLHCQRNKLYEAARHLELDCERAGYTQQELADTAPLKR